MNVSDFIIKPVISEKSETLRERNVYIFEIHKNVNKKMVKEAIQSIYGLWPSKVNVLVQRGKRKKNRYGYGYTKTKKKAYVYLNSKEKIDIFKNV